MKKHIFSTNQKHPLGKRRCTFCTNQMKGIDYKDLGTLKAFINGFKKIRPATTRACASSTKNPWPAP